MPSSGQWRPVIRLIKHQSPMLSAYLIISSPDVSSTLPLDYQIHTPALFVLAAISEAVTCASAPFVINFKTY
eukprot:970915-Amorphochlora_amoeboformis.AAC.1